MIPLFVIVALHSGTPPARTVPKGFALLCILPDDFQSLTYFVAMAKSGADTTVLAQMIEERCFDTVQAVGSVPEAGLELCSPGGMALRLARAGEPLRVPGYYADERGWARALRDPFGQWRNCRGRAT